MKRIIELNPDEIHIPDRIRKDFDRQALNRLKESIEQLGQLQPIGVIERKVGGKNYVLVFGHRRLLALKELGLKVKAVVLDAPISVLDEKIMEFVENAVREDFSPAEKAVAVKLLHEKLTDERKNWSVEKTARILGLTRQYVSDLIRIGKAVQDGTIGEKEQKSASMTRLRQLTSYKERIQVLKEEVKKQVITPKNYQFFCMDSFRIPVLKPEWKGEFDLFLTDPPYGINVVEKSHIDRTHTKFDDNKDKMTTEFCAEILKLADFLLSDRGILIVFCSIEQFMSYRFLANEFGFEYHYPKPLIWINKSTGIPYNKYCPSSCYEFMFFAKRNPDTEIYNINPPDWFNIKTIPSGQRNHPTEKPEELFFVLLQNFALPSFKVIDPFCGTGGSIRACMSHGLPRAVGVDNEQDFITKAKELLAKKLPKEVSK